MFVQDRLQEEVEGEKGKESTWIRANLQKKIHICAIIATVNYDI